ncbi:hypothetical protein TNCV_1620711 [Trichonephila clavipes]|nr:hypothetical protein TNCV_1620711 [Trichonephila clavipes]
MDFIGQSQCTTTTCANDEASVSIVLKLRKISQTHDAQLQWISSYVNITAGNDIVDRLAKEGSENETATGTSLTFQELYSNARSELNLIRRIPPTLHCTNDHRDIPWLSAGTQM